MRSYFRDENNSVPKISSSPFWRCRHLLLSLFTDGLGICNTRAPLTWSVVCRSDAIFRNKTNDISVGIIVQRVFNFTSPLQPSIYISLHRDSKYLLCYTPVDVFPVEPQRVIGRSLGSLQFSCPLSRKEGLILIQCWQVQQLQLNEFFFFFCEMESEKII